MKTAVIYARYSSDSQTEQSIEGQLRVCEEYAKKNNILILNTYIDRAMTGTNDNRPDFQRMLKDSTKHEWDYVLVYKLDRFSRNKYESVIHKRTLKENGVKVISAMENIPDTPEGIILESLLEGMNQYYSAELAQKVKRGMRETRLKGYNQGGTLPYGYKLNGRNIVIDEEKSIIVKYIFEQYSNGIYVRDIIKSLTQKGILNHNKQFAENTVYHILKNEKYTGIYVKNNEVFENMYPQMISKELFEKVRSKSKVNAYGKRSIKTTYLLRNKLKCGYCGKPISAECGTTKNGKRIYYYKCKGKKRYNFDCPKTTIQKDILEDFVLKEILYKLNDPNIMNKLVEELMKAQKDYTNRNSVINYLIKEKKQKETALNNILKAIEQGIMNNTTNKRMQELENQIEDLQRKILVERSKLSTIVPEQEIRRYYSQALEQEPTMLINYLIKEIKMFNDTMEITFNSPINKSPDSQGFSFYTEKCKIKNIQNKNFATYQEIEIKMFI